MRTIYEFSELKLEDRPFPYKPSGENKFAVAAIPYIILTLAAAGLWLYLFTEPFRKLAQMNVTPTPEISLKDIATPSEGAAIESDGGLAIKFAILFVIGLVVTLTGVKELLRWRHSLSLNKSSSPTP